MQKIKSWFKNLIQKFKWIKINSIDAVITVLENVQLTAEEFERLKKIVNKNKESSN
ncbi:hypothetical protein [Mycoplasma seminis]|uniref:XkdX family protein n=1 Tax=Mycoplasma seminis TaxID=512749 RepID=A0ABY9HAG8_9MOLU|nr:hypothetical protein [Mycoplasma seminis]WLP85246.1 hypothetical protein Q8852_02900 [Mycoplasma seminis]